MIKTQKVISFILKKRKVVYLSLGIVCLLIVFFYGFLLFIPWVLPEGKESIEITIERGMTPDEIATLLEEKGVIRGERKFLQGAKLLGVTRKLQAGRYRFEGRLSNYSVLRKLSKGRVITSWVTFPEGVRSTKIAGILRERFEIDSIRFMALVTDSAYCRSMGIDASNLEGYLYPDTYRFHLDPSEEEIIAQMISRFREVFVDSLRQRADDLGMTIHQVMTLASIVEGEAALDSERTSVAALYHNRLKRGMLLQADPTIQYIIKDGPRRLLNRDLGIDSPYNTYIHSGLPPGPVNNPGLASILATLYPASVDYLYMVANGDGSHTFSRTIREHLKAKQRFDQVRRKVRRQR